MRGGRVLVLTRVIQQGKRLRAKSYWGRMGEWINRSDLAQNFSLTLPADIRNFCSVNNFQLLGVVNASKVRQGTFTLTGLEKL